MYIKERSFYYRRILNENLGNSWGNGMEFGGCFGTNGINWFTNYMDDSDGFGYGDPGALNGSNFDYFKLDPIGMKEEMIQFKYKI